MLERLNENDSLKEVSADATDAPFLIPASELRFRKIRRRRRSLPGGAEINCRFVDLGKLKK
jgi:hypothetical protein